MPKTAVLDCVDKAVDAETGRRQAGYPRELMPVRAIAPLLPKLTQREGLSPSDRIGAR